LFGHVAGAFTGASKPHAGYFRAADGGVLFLDEVGELAQAIQAKLLRALEEHTVTPLGGDRPIACHPRVVAATNKDLRAAALSGAFRGDLYARLAEVIINPTLRDRREDIVPLLRDARLAPPMTADLRSVDPLSLAVQCPRAPQAGGRSARARRWTGSWISTSCRIASPRASPVRGANPARPELRHPSDDELEPATRSSQEIADVARARRSRKQVYRWLEIHGVDPAAFRSR
jgi:sigma54-dependent transcription regulator